jgi:uncharacterized repeat protein (TIGR01451 family)
MIRKSIFLLLIIVFGFCNLSSAYESDDIEWVSDTTTTFHWGDSETNDDYVIKAEDFNEDGYVYITISRDNQILKSAPLHVGNSVSAEDEIQVYVKKVETNIDAWTGNMDDPTAEVEIFRRGLPDFEMTIEFDGDDDDSYDPKSISSPSTITATITVENVGDAEAKDVDLTIDTGGLELVEGKLIHHFTSLDKEEVTDPVTIGLKVPLLWDETSYAITAEAKGDDIKGIEHDNNDTESLTIEQKWGLYISKSITEEVYMSDTAHALVNIRNGGICDLNSITVTDTMVEGLELKDSVTLEKTISLKPGESTQELISYTLKPVTPGTYTAPAATAKFTASNGKEYTVTSETSGIEINGPNIVLTKTVSSSDVAPGEEVTVTVKVQNTGNRDASVTVSDPSDMLPESTTFISGETGFKDVVKKESSSSLSYVIRMDAVGDVKLPAATASFVDMEEYKGEKISNMPVISVTVPPTEGAESSGATTSQSEDGASGQGNDATSGVEDKTEPGFEVSIAVAAFAGVYLLFRRKN